MPLGLFGRISFSDPKSRPAGGLAEMYRRRPAKKMGLAHKPIVPLDKVEWCLKRTLPSCRRRPLFGEQADAAWNGFWHKQQKCLLSRVVLPLGQGCAECRLLAHADVDRCATGVCYATPKLPFDNFDRREHCRRSLAQMDRTAIVLLRRSALRSHVRIALGGHSQCRIVS